MTPQQLQYLLERFDKQALSPGEREELLAYLNQLNQVELPAQLVTMLADMSKQGPPSPLPADKAESVLRAVLQVDKAAEITQDISDRPVHYMHFLRRWWWAAAILLLFGTGAYLYTSTVFTKPLVATKNEIPAKDILPGSERAILTLADGSKIALDNAANGAIAYQGNVDVVKMANGEIRYNSKGITKGEAMINAMSTPRGGQYKLVLPDGSKVWLNAASSIIYPAAFVDNNRKVKVTGEVYMEVVQNKTKPFIVDIDGKSSVQVLGTSFNINSYADDDNIKTTLVEGSVKVNDQVMLKPGQQAVIKSNVQAPDKKQIIQVQPANINQVLAWKNGRFDFDGAKLPIVMKQLQRWYDIDVIYEGKIPDFEFNGGMRRGVKLSTIMGFLSDNGVKARLENKTLIIGSNSR